MAVLAEGRAGAWRRGADFHWESWSRNGEACITGLDPPFAGGARLASCLTSLLRSFASSCRRTHDATGMLAFTCASPRMPSTLALSIALSFDLALRDPQLIRARVRRRGGEGDRGHWPALWLEGSAYEYVLSRDPFPPVGTPRRNLLLLAEERQAYVPAQTPARASGGLHREWRSGLDAVSAVDDPSVGGILGQDELAFAVNLLVLVHAWPAGKGRPRLSLEDSHRRHEALVADLDPDATARKLSLAWHALWRLPPAMTWAEPDGSPWMRFPAVSVLAAVRPIRKE